MKNKMVYLVIMAMAVIALMLAGCASPAASNQPGSNTQGALPTSSTAVQGGTSAQPGQSVAAGRLEVVVTDAPARDKITAIVVTLKSVQVHAAGTDTATPAPSAPAVEGTPETADQPEDSAGWTTLDLAGNTQFDLLQVKTNPETLASVPTAAGSFTQARLEVESIEVTFLGSDDKPYTQDATVPSGKIKFIQPFKVTSSDVTQLVFDFDAAQSVNVTGEGKVLFKPVIRLTVNQKPGNASPGATNSGKNRDNPAALQITTSALPAGTVNVAYGANFKLEAAGGSPPYKWSVSTGTLPAGLALNQATGAISGTPTAAGDVNLTLAVTDNSKPEAKTSTKEFTLHIAASP